MMLKKLEPSMPVSVAVGAETVERLLLHNQEHLRADVGPLHDNVVHKNWKSAGHAQGSTASIPWLTLVGCRFYYMVFVASMMVATTRQAPSTCVLAVKPFSDVCRPLPMSPEDSSSATSFWEQDVYCSSVAMHTSRSMLCLSALCGVSVTSVAPSDKSVSTAISWSDDRLIR